MPGRAKIIVQDLVKIFRVKGKAITALAGVSFTVQEGAFLVIVGPSGCGKTTLLRILAGLDYPSQGTVEVYHADRSRPLNAMVFQEQSVLPWMTVRDNVAYGLRLRGIPREERYRIADYYIRMVGLSKFTHAYPHQLSGGMKQRVSVARAFANDPEILLMDEPFAALDEQNKLLLQEELLRIWEGSGKTVVYITHSIDEAINLGDKVMVMTAHPGRIKCVIDIDIPRPRKLETIRNHPRFNALYQHIWNELRSEVLQAKKEEGLEVAVS